MRGGSPLSVFVVDRGDSPSGGRDRQSYSLAAGEKGTFKIKLTATGRSTLAHAKHHRLSATLEASVSGGATAKKTVAVSEAKSKKRK